MHRIQTLRNWIRAPAPTRREAAVWIALGLALATGLRSTLNVWLDGSLAFATYQPIVLALTLRFGWGAGLCAALLGALLGASLFLPGDPRSAFGPAHVAAAAEFIIVSGLIIGTAALLRRALRGLDEASGRQDTMNAELQHRVKNTLSVVQALASETGRSAVDFESFYENFRERLLALATAHNLLSSADWTTCELSTLVHETLRPFASARIRIEGRPAQIAAVSCTPLVLALHELATNAVKHGALSSPDGEVTLRWEREPAGHRLVWCERGGPRVTPPTRTGLGRRLLRTQVGLDAVNLVFASGGVVCEIQLPPAGNALSNRSLPILEAPAVGGALLFSGHSTYG